MKLETGGYMISCNCLTALTQIFLIEIIEQSTVKHFVVESNIIYRG